MNLGDFRKATAHLPDETPMEAWMSGEELNDHLSARLDDVEITGLPSVAITIELFKAIDEYDVAVYWIDDDGTRHYYGMVRVNAESEEVAIEIAVEEARDERIEHWVGEIN